MKNRLKVSGLKQDKLERNLGYRKAQLLLIEVKVLLELVGDADVIDLMSFEPAEVCLDLRVVVALVVGPEDLFACRVIRFNLPAQSSEEPCHGLAEIAPPGHPHAV